MRPAPLIAGALVVAAAAFAVVAFTTGDDDEPPAPAASTPAPATPAPASDGQAVWVKQGCGSCHTLAAAGATGTLGPDLGSSLRGMPAAYIKESIVAPNKVAAAGYGTGVMPADYASRIPPRDLDALVRFLRAAAGE